MKTSFKTMIAFLGAITLAACQPSISRDDAIFYGYCVGIYPHAEVAIQRGYLRYPTGTFRRVQEQASRSFPAPVEWSVEMQELFSREIGRGQNHGGAISRGDVQSQDITRLDACIGWANDL